MSETIKVFGADIEVSDMKVELVMVEHGVLATLTVLSPMVDDEESFDILAAFNVHHRKWDIGNTSEIMEELGALYKEWKAAVADA